MTVDSSKRTFSCKMAAPPAVLVRLLRAPSATGETSAEEEHLWDAPNGGVPDPVSIIELHLSHFTNLPSYNLTPFTSLRVLHACLQTQLPNLALPPSLTLLNLDRSPFRDLNCLRGLTSLVSLSLSGSRVDCFADLLPLLSLPALRTLALQPQPSTDPWTHVGGIGSSPVCATPSYRAYVLRTFPQLTHLDGIAADQQRALMEFVTHFQTTPSDYPSRPPIGAPCSSSLASLLFHRASGRSAAAVRRCAASIVAREARVGEVCIVFTLCLTRECFISIYLC